MEKDYIVIESGNNSYNRPEIMMKNASVTLPTNLPAGSTAYTADGSYLAMFDGEQWVEWNGGTGGDDNE